MRLAELTALFGQLDFPRSDGHARPPRDHVRAVEGAVRAGLSDDELPLELLALEIERRDGAPELAPFYVVPEVGVRVAFAYWRPGRAAGAHEHSDWTVTAVLHNALDVATFDWDATARARRLVPKRLFSAEAGRVGHIYGPCIHDPRNPTARWSISLHLFGPSDGPVLEAQVGPVEGLAPAAPRPAAAHGRRPRARPRCSPKAPVPAHRRRYDRRAALRDARGGTSGPESTLPRPAELSSDPGAHRRGRGLLAHERECVRRAQVDALAHRGPRAAALLARLHARGDAGTRARAARALGRPEELDPRAALVRRWPGVDLDVVWSADRAELLARCGERAQLLVRVPAWAEPALRALAAASELRPRDIPGLAEAEQLALARALVDWGTFQPFAAQEN
ncbi:hypothetical protein SCE1572_16620 [Sorangium cellulosum So0157-2]|uniref:Cysteine dioxygenase n=1 Tax=Sorangium cellulosum So0157-2 TaxID=1254432 RepID=S4XS44_SORCE|nr:hypothetical protein [Sorangium cellulosum]AGP35982.1 hypothetical protein SCE1572_16620 [Sorangium cellulosum So0157-2]